MTSGQVETIALLVDPATHGGAAVERVDTHGAIVFIAGERAYKLKRATRFTYLDYSTPARRRAACEAELALNCRTAPAIYESVAAVTRGRDGRLALGGGGEAVDWVVVMRRFDRALEFDRLAEAGALDAARIAALAGAVARFHAAEPPVPGFGGAAGIAEVLDENRAEFARQRERLDPAEAAAVDAACRAAFASVAGLLDARAAAGAVKRCHGDLHLGNVVLLDGRPTPLDCVEFSDSIATIDVLFDLAFLLMDLERRATRPLANAALNAYLEAAPDEIPGLVALPLFLALRAAIRAHTGAAAAAAQADPARVASLLAASRRHLAAAPGFLATPPTRLVAVGGVSGTGKSTLARALAPGLGGACGALVLRSDAIRKRRAGVAPTDRLPAERYTAAESAAVYAAMFERAAAALAAGRSAVLDAVFLREDERESAAALARRAGARFDGLWLELPRDLAAARIRGRRSDVSDATVGVLDAQLAREAGAVAWPTLDAGRGAEAVAEAARAALGRRG